MCRTHLGHQNFFTQSFYACNVFFGRARRRSYWHKLLYFLFTRTRCRANIDDCRSHICLNAQAATLCRLYISAVYLIKRLMLRIVYSKCTLQAVKSKIQHHFVISTIDLWHLCRFSGVYYRIVVLPPPPPAANSVRERRAEMNSLLSATAMLCLIGLVAAAKFRKCDTLECEQTLQRPADKCDPFNCAHYVGIRISPPHTMARAIAVC